MRARWKTCWKRAAPNRSRGFPAARQSGHPARVRRPRSSARSKESRSFARRSGLPVLVHRKPGSAIVHLGVFAFGGSRDEPEELAGITTLVARSMLKGTRRRSAAQLAEDVEMLGGQVSARASRSRDSAGRSPFRCSISRPRPSWLATSFRTPPWAGMRSRPSEQSLFPT